MILGQSRRAVLALGLVLAAVLTLAAQDKKNSHSAGVIASDKASAEDVGLPLYPGARLHKDKSDDSPTAQLGLWGKDSGFRLVVMKLESNDPAEKVAEFYRKALAKYGKVLDCSDPKTHAAGKSKNELTCDSDEPRKGEMVFKAGTREVQHAVGIQSNGSHSLFELVYLEQRGVDDGK